MRPALSVIFFKKTFYFWEENIFYKKKKNWFSTKVSVFLEETPQLGNSHKSLYSCIECIVVDNFLIIIRYTYTHFFIYVVKSCISFVLSVYVNASNQEE